VSPSESADSIDYLVIGHVTKDLSVSPPGESSLGGTAAYAALTARVLGRRPAILTSFGSDLALSSLAGIPLHSVPASRSTAFRNQYNGDRREQHLLAQAAALDATDVPRAWRSASIVHLAPVAGEVPPSLAAAFPDSALVGVTPQGWMRAWDGDGLVSYRPWTTALQAVERADAVIIGVEDVGGDEAELERLAAACRLLVATEGSHGSRVYWNRDVRRFPSPAAKALDPTGAGDIFAAAFFIRYHQTRDPWEAARFANRIASTSVTRRGLAGVPTPEEADQAAMVWTR
jgi:sugar/nucleoside kinase (ribokinase family)